MTNLCNCDFGVVHRNAIRWAFHSLVTECLDRDSFSDLPQHCDQKRQQPSALHLDTITTAHLSSFYCTERCWWSRWGEEFQQLQIIGRCISRQRTKEPWTGVDCYTKDRELAQTTNFTTCHPWKYTFSEYRSAAIRGAHDGLHPAFWTPGHDLEYPNEDPVRAPAAPDSLCADD